MTPIAVNDFRLDHARSLRQISKIGVIVKLFSPHFLSRHDDGTAGLEAPHRPLSLWHARGDVVEGSCKQLSWGKKLTTTKNDSK